MEILKECHSNHENHLQTIFFTQEHYILGILFLKSFIFFFLFHFLNLPFLSQIKFFCILYKRSIVSLLRLVINKRYVTLETGKNLTTVILPFEVNCLIRHNFKMFFILTILSEKILSCSRFLLYEK